MINDIVLGDAIKFDCNAGENITDWKIRCEIYQNDKSIKKASANTGGSDDQIEIIDAENGEFRIHIDSGETTDFEPDIAKIEIEIEEPTGDIYTVLKDNIKFNREEITWEEPS